MSIFDNKIKTLDFIKTYNNIKKDKIKYAEQNLIMEYLKKQIPFASNYTFENSFPVPFINEYVSFYLLSDITSWHVSNTTLETHMSIMHLTDNCEIILKNDDYKLYKSLESIQ